MRFFLMDGDLTKKHLRRWGITFPSPQFMPILITIGHSLIDVRFHSTFPTRTVGKNRYSIRGELECLRFHWLVTMALLVVPTISRSSSWSNFETLYLSRTATKSLAMASHSPDVMLRWA